MGNKKILATFFLATCYLLLFTNTSSVLAKSHAHTIIGTVLAIDTDNSLVTIKSLDKKNKKGGNVFGSTYIINYYSSNFLRSSGGRLTENEVQIGDSIKTVVSDKNVSPEGVYFAKKLTDLSICYTKIQGSMGDVSDDGDTFIIQTKKGAVTVNLEDNTDTIHKPIKQQNNPLTKAEALGYFNSNTMKMYGTRSLIMWSR